MNFKYVNLPDGHGLDDQHLKFLELFDNALVGLKEGVSDKKDIDTIKEEFKKEMADMKNNFDYVKMQEQINEVFARLEGSAPIYTEQQAKEKELHLNNKWIKSMLKKDKEGMEKAVMELKTTVWPAHVLHTGSNSEIDGGVDSQGGYLIPELFLAEVNRFALLGGIARRDMRYLPFSGPGNERKIPTLLGNVTVGWVDEGETKPKTKPTFALVTQELKVLAAMVIMTEEITEDSAINLVTLCSQLIGEAIAVEEDRVFLAGDATDPFLGVINALGTTPAVLAAGLVGTDLRPEHLLAMTVLLTETAVPGSSFYMHREIFAALRAYRSDAVVADDRRGNYLVQSPTGSTPGSIWGYPVVLSDQLPDWDDIQDADEPVLFFGNLGRTCVYGDKMGIRVKLLDQATVTDSDGNLINLAERDMLALRVHKRVGYVPVLPAGICVLHTGPVS